MIFFCDRFCVRCIEQEWEREREECTRARACERDFRSKSRDILWRFFFFFYITLSVNKNVSGYVGLTRVLIRTVFLSDNRNRNCPDPIIIQKKKNAVPRRNNNRHDCETFARLCGPSCPGCKCRIRPRPKLDRKRTSDPAILLIIYYELLTCPDSLRYFIQKGSFSSFS